MNVFNCPLLDCRDRLHKLSQLDNVHLCTLLDLPEISSFVRQRISQTKSDLQEAIATKGELLKTCDQTQKIKMIEKIKTIANVAAGVFSAFALLFCVWSFFTAHLLLHLTFLLTLISVTLLSRTIEQIVISVHKRKKEAVVSTKEKIDKIDQKGRSLLELLENLPNLKAKEHFLGHMDLKRSACQRKFAGANWEKQSSMGSAKRAIALKSRNDLRALSTSASEIKNIAPEKVLILKIAKSMSLPRAPKLQSLGPLPIQIDCFKALFEHFSLPYEKKGVSGPITPLFIEESIEAGRSLPQKLGQCEIVELNDLNSSSIDAKKGSGIGQISPDKGTKSTFEKISSVNLCLGTINLIAMSIFGLYCLDQFVNQIDFRHPPCT